MGQVSKHNPSLTKRGGIEKFGRAKAYKNKFLWKHKKKVAVKKVVAEAGTKDKTIGGAGNGGKRTVPATKANKYYSIADVPKAKGNNKHAGTATLRSSITPGTVLILLSGRFRGKRVVFLKQLESGLLMVTGPYNVNGVPLKRVDQTYVIATSTQVDISKVKTGELNDAFFARPAGAKKGADFYADQEAAPKTLDANRAKVQKAVDGALSFQGDMKDYMRGLFTLRKGMYPHEMKF